MPIEVIRFGVGHRRPDGPRGTQGIRGQVIHSDGRGVVSELAFRRGAVVEPHSNPNTTYFIVIEGGGWVAVGDERLRVAAGEAVVWPAGIVHGAWTDVTEMRALVVELPGGEPLPPGVLPGQARAIGAGEPRPPRGEGQLAGEDLPPPPADPTAGEPR